MFGDSGVGGVFAAGYLAEEGEDFLLEGCFGREGYFLQVRRQILVAVVGGGGAWLRDSAGGLGGEVRRLCDR